MLNCKQQYSNNYTVACFPLFGNSKLNIVAKLPNFSQLRIGLIFKRLEGPQNTTISTQGLYCKYQPL